MDLSKVEQLLETLIERQNSMVRMLNHIELSLFSIDKGLESAPHQFEDMLERKLKEFRALSDDSKNTRRD
jgi:hypothetical protein